MHKIFDVLYQQDNKIQSTRLACKNIDELPTLVKDFFGDDAVLVSYMRV